MPSSSSHHPSSHSRSGTAFESRRDTGRSRADSSLHTLGENGAPVPFGADRGETRRGTTRRESMRQESRSTKNEKTDFLKTLKPETRTNSGNSRAVVPYGADRTSLKTLKEESRTGSGNSRAVVPYESSSRTQGRSRSSSTTARPSQAGFETRLERLESKDNTIARSSSTRAPSSSSRGPGFETRLQQLEKPSDASSKVLDAKLAAMEAKMEALKVESHKKELEAKNDKIREAEAARQRAENELAAEREKKTPVVVVGGHGYYCGCLPCSYLRAKYIGY